MVCDRCEECRSSGYRFCIGCGDPLTSVPRTPDDLKEIDGDNSTLKTGIAAAFAGVIAIILTMAVMLPNFTETFDFVHGYDFELYIFMPVYIGICTLEGPALQAFWVFIAAAAVICLAMAVWRSRCLFIPGTPDYTEKASKTPLYWIMFLFCTTLVIELAINYIFMLGGSDIETPGWITEMTLPEEIFSMTEAGVWEEIAFRAVPIGLVMAIAALISKRKDFWKCFFGGFGMSYLAIIMILITAVVFGYAHVSGWGLWKMLPTVVGGIAFGYLFVRFGLYASIFFHIINDYMSLWTELYEIPGSLEVLAIFFLGFICIPLLLVKLGKGLGKLKDMKWLSFYQDNSDPRDD